jgi:hypothetical protein
MKKNILNRFSSANSKYFRLFSFSKAQGAMEFLTTYGWAIMILAVVLSGLGYFGVFNPSNFVKSSCQFDSGISCPLFSFVNSSDGFELKIHFQNVLGDRLILENISIGDVEGVNYCVAEKFGLLDDPSKPVVLSSFGSQQEKDSVAVFGHDCPVLDSYGGSKQRFLLKLYYRRGDATMPTVTSGSLTTFIDSSE